MENCGENIIEKMNLCVVWLEWEKNFYVGPRHFPLGSTQNLSL